MGADSKIEWTHHTFNPWRGCTKATWTDSTGKTRLHPGCLNCYAETDRSVRMHGIRWGKGQPRVPKAESGWAEPLAWARAAARAGERQRVFCASLADVLDPEVPDAVRERLWDTIRKTAYCGVDAHGRLESFTPTKPDATMRIGGLDWLLLTKRPEAWQRIPEDVRPLVWFGTSVSDQDTMNEWGARLMQARGFRYRFLSVEPLVAPIEIGLMGTVPKDWGYGYRPVADLISWVIVGGESGPKARPCNVEWVRDIIRQCREAGVPCFVKQLGAEPVDAIDRWHEWRALGTGFDSMSTKTGTGSVRLEDHKGRDPAEWPEDLRAREFPLTR